MCVVRSVISPKAVVLTLYALLGQAPTPSATNSTKIDQAPTPSATNSTEIVSYSDGGFFVPSSPSNEIVFARDVEAEWNETVLKTHNSHRSRAGLPEFQWNEALAGVARDWLQSDTMSLHCDQSTIAHSPKDFRTKHPASPYYYLGETAVSKELPAQEVWNAVQLAQEAIGRWGEPMVRNVSYGRWGSACTVGNVRSGVAEGFFQSLWAETREVGCEAALCGVKGWGDHTSWKTFLLVCEYGPGGNVIGELPFSPTTATILGLSSSPCDGQLTDSEWLHWERSDGLNYPLPAGRGAISSSAFGFLGSVRIMSLFVLIVNAAM